MLLGKPVRVVLEPRALIPGTRLPRLASAFYSSGTKVLSVVIPISREN